MLAYILSSLLWAILFLSIIFYFSRSTNIPQRLSHASCISSYHGTFYFWLVMCSYASLFFFWLVICSYDGLILWLVICSYAGLVIWLVTCSYATLELMICSYPVFYPSRLSPQGSLFLFPRHVVMLVVICFIPHIEGPATLSTFLS